jgi:S-DNA-T family DNA segregation ATPase FtsK/SpoIIIE
LRATCRGLVLAPGEPGSGDVFGIALGWHCDPAHPHLPGRGVVQDGRTVQPVQVYLAEP